MLWDIFGTIAFYFSMVDSEKALLHLEPFQGNHWKEKELKN